MMCEADFEEVFRSRPLSHRLARALALAGALAIGGSSVLTVGLGLNAPQTLLAQAGFLILAGSLFHRLSLKPTSARLAKTNLMLQTIAQGGGNLTLRLDRPGALRDEITEIAQWLNSLVDNFRWLARLSDRFLPPVSSRPRDFWRPFKVIHRSTREQIRTKRLT